jgi:hypothetical protein
MIFSSFSSSSSLNVNSVPSFATQSLFSSILNPHDTAPEAANEPPFLVYMVFTSVTVLFVLSVTAFMSIPTPPGPNPSYITSCKSAESDEDAFFTALSITSLGTFSFLADSTTDTTDAELLSPFAAFTAT